MSTTLNLKSVKEYLVDTPSPLLTAKTIQIIVVRQLMDFTILRTEDSRELNIVELPRSLEDTSAEVYGLFLASKQKAPESRHFAEYLRQYQNDYKCFLPQDLCLECPRCVLFGAVKPKGSQYNIKHRIEYSSAYSLASFRDISETITFNAVSEQNQKTGQALNVSHNFKPLTMFPSIVTLRSVSAIEFALYIKTLLSCHSYGAESRVKGDVRNEIIGVVGGLEEIITPLELNLELRSLLNGDSPVHLNELVKQMIAILESYKSLAGDPQDINILTGTELDTLLTEIRKVKAEDLVRSLFKDASKFTEEASTST